MSSEQPFGVSSRPAAGLAFSGAPSLDEPSIDDEKSSGAPNISTRDGSPLRDDSANTISRSAFGSRTTGSSAPNNTMPNSSPRSSTSAGEVHQSLASEPASRSPASFKDDQLASRAEPMDSSRKSGVVEQKSYAVASANDEFIPRSGSLGHGGYYGLAAPLPSTLLGRGADQGATKLEAIPGIRGSTLDAPSSVSYSPSAASPTGDTGSNGDITSSGAAKSLGVADFAQNTMSSGVPSSHDRAASNNSASRSSGIGGQSLPGISESSAFPTGAIKPSSVGALNTRQSNDRSSSTASITAIRGGHEGSLKHQSPLANQSITSAAGQSAGSNGQRSTSGQRSTTRGTGPGHTTSLTPGNEEEGVGHPLTRSKDGASRSTGSYPIPEHSVAETGPRSDLQGSGTMYEAPTNTVTTANNASSRNASAFSGNQGVQAGSVGTIGPRSSSASNSFPITANPTPSKSTYDDTPARTATTAAPTSPSQKFSSNEDEQTSGHRRTSSNTGSEGAKKKGGFMSKLKEKLTHHGGYS